MQSNHRAYLLPPDPAAKSKVARADGDAGVVEPAKLAAPAMPAMPATVAQQLSVAREEIIVLRSLLHGIGASLCTMAGQLAQDVEAAAGKSRLEADRKRRF